MRLAEAPHTGAFAEAMLNGPFVLLDDAREGGAAACLYRRPVEIVTADALEEVRPALARLRAARAEGLHAAGFLSYEAGAAFMPRPLPVAASGSLLWFGLFDAVETIAAADVPTLLPDPAGAWAGPVQPLIDEERYRAQVGDVQALITAGDIYQANLTFRASVAVEGDPLALYARLRARARAGHGAVVDTGSLHLLSLSPELFFALEGRALTCRPMKGTAPRRATPAADRAAVDRLAADPKQQAENLMIVDLARNDLARVARPGSVAVPALFDVETYPTIHQMTSTVTATLAGDRDALDVIEAMFPCGSITGAPKMRAMEVTAAIEDGPRGPYTGAIGCLDANGDAVFNVAIRTLVLPRGAEAATLGLGSGIVADSRAEQEWDECLAKGAFVGGDAPPFDLLETMCFDPEDGVVLLEHHLARLKRSADRFGFAFNRHAARNELQAATFRLRESRKVRFTLARSGAIAIEVAPLPPGLALPVEVAIVPLPVSPSDFRLAHKITRRRFYDEARERAGTPEVVFVTEEGWLTEGSFTSLFCRRGEKLVTPPGMRGLIPGVLRADLLARGEAEEGDLRPADLAQGFFVGNALRGLMPAVLARDVAAPL